MANAEIIFEERRRLAFSFYGHYNILAMEQYLYEKVFREFYYKRVNYLIVGGIALNLHGVPRATFDLDILVSWDDENIQKIDNILKKLRFKSTAPISLSDLKSTEKREELSRKKHMFAINFYNIDDPLEEIDILIKGHAEFEKLFARKKVIKIDDFDIYLISLEDLIKLKKRSHRNKDKEDMKKLLIVKNFKEHGH